MKKIITAALVALLLVSISACAFAATGLGSYTKTTSTPATADAAASVSVNTTICAVTLDAEGKIVEIDFDVIQPKSNWETAVVETQTKLELKEGYNMAAYGQPNVEGGTVKEWYIQSAAFSAHVVGKTADEIKGMETKEVNAHLISTDEALLAAGCTMQITDICAVVAEAVANAR